MKTMIRRVCALAFILSGVTGCMTTKTGSPGEDQILRVGVSADYPPVVYKQGDDIVGLEADFAQAMAKALGRTLQFVEVKWEDQIGALLDGQTDLIMSGMTITDSRKVRIDFSEPYLGLGLMALVRTRDVHKYPTRDSIINCSDRIGVQKGSTGDVFAHQQCRETSGITWLNPKDAPFYLVNNKIDVFIYDGPAVVWMASENEAELAAIRTPLTEEHLAWGIRKTDPELRDTVNRILAQWKKDGSLDRLLHRWLPYLNRAP